VEVGRSVLELADIEPYLRDRGLISARAVVDGGLRVDDHSRLNRVFLVAAEGERSLVVKVADQPGSNGVSREAAVLASMRALGGEGPGAFLPNVVAHDPIEGVLILEGTAGAEDLAHRHARGWFSRALAGRVGEGLAWLHEAAPERLADLPGGIDPALALRLHDPDWESTRVMSGAALQFTRVIQSSDELCAGLDGLRESWSEEAVIHGDVRWDNCVALPSAGRPRRWGRIQLIDWEHAAPGDPAYDLGAFLGEYLCAWVQSIPVVDPSDVGLLIGHARLPLRRMRPSLTAFWEAYIRHRGPGLADPERPLRRATQFTAARLLTIALEQAQTLAELRPGLLGLVHLSENILRRPDEASIQLLGLELSRAPA
jgi:aminoglycoside phosphotransferase (APT) family kinase protein